MLECRLLRSNRALKNCPNLPQTLSAMGNCSITQIPHTFGQDLPKLSRLYLDLNDIKTSIPPSIILLHHGNELDFRIFGNHNLQYPPPYIAYQGMDAICEFIATKGDLIPDTNTINDDDDDVLVGQEFIGIMKSSGSPYFPLVSDDDVRKKLSLRDILSTEHMERRRSSRGTATVDK
jgi:hypothetical protein